MKKVTLLLGFIMTLSIGLQAQNQVMFPFPRQFQPQSIEMNIDVDVMDYLVQEKVKYEFTYQDNVTRAAVSLWEDNDWVFEGSMIEQEFDEHDNIIREAYYVWDDDDWAMDQEIFYRYDYQHDNNDNPLSYISYIYDTTDEMEWGSATYHYTQGVLVKMEQVVRDVERPDSPIEFTRHFTYDFDKNLVSEKRYISSEEVDELGLPIYLVFDYEYGDDGNLTFSEVSVTAELFPGIPLLTAHVADVEFFYSSVNINSPLVADVKVYADKAGLSIQTDKAETVSIYTVDGKMLNTVRIQPGINTIPVANAPQVIIVKGDSGWAKKVLTK